MSKVQCTACGATTIRDLGPLPEPVPTFGGELSPTGPAPGNLWHCLECHLRFRFPYLSQVELTALYERLPNSVWSTPEDRPLWKDVRARCNRYSPGRTILDVGCFTGDFLGRMPPEWTRLGIEPGQAARQIAKSKGIEIIGYSLESVAIDRCQADVVTLLDVIEHFEDPFRLLSRASSLLNPGGCIVVLTGNAASTAFRLLSNNYWYCSIPEHVSFLSRRWFEWAAPRLGMALRNCEYVSAEHFDFYQWLRDGARNTLFALMQRLRTAGIDPSFLRPLPVVGRAVSWRTCPWWLTAKDQILVTLQKKTA